MMYYSLCKTKANVFSHTRDKLQSSYLEGNILTKIEEYRAEHRRSEFLLSEEDLGK